MKRLITLLAAVIAAVATLSIASGRMSTGLGHSAQAAPAHTSSSTASSKKPAAAAFESSQSSSSTSSASSASHSSASTSGYSTVDGSAVSGVSVTGGSSASVVYRLTADLAEAGNGTLTLFAPGASLDSTSGAGRQFTATFVQNWSNDPFAGSLSAVLLTADGTRHALTLSAPATAPGRLTFRMQSATAVSQQLATETGVVDAGAVAGVSGTLHGVTVFLAMNAGRTVNGCQLAPGTDCDGKNLVQVVLSAANLAGASLRGATLWQAVLHGADLTGADLTGIRGFRADFSMIKGADLVGAGADLTQASLISAQLTGATLDRAKLSRADLTDVDLSGASLRSLAASNVYARNANFAQANLAGATFAFADLSGADFRGANLAGVNLDRANLTGADFSGANLTGAVLNRATVKRAVFSHAIFGDTKCVDGLVRNHCG